MNATTERLRIRPLTTGDLDALAAIYDDPQVMRFSLGRLDRDKTREKLERHVTLNRESGQGAHALEDLGDGRFVGIAGLQPQTVDGVDEIEIGYRLMPESWGKGLATEATRALLAHAFAELGLPRVISIIEPANVGSIRVAEKAGLTLEKETMMWDRDVRIYVAAPNKP